MTRFFEVGLSSLLLACAAVGPLACGGSAARDDSARAPSIAENDDGSAAAGSTSSETATEGTATEASSGSLGIDEKQVDGVWLFWHASPDHSDALLTGPVSIVDGCLQVAGYVVIWHESWLADVDVAVAALAAGDAPDFSVGGGEWGARLPSAIEARCGAARVWSGSPLGE